MSGTITIFLLFCKFSLLCFGGGYMLIPLIISDCVEKYHFITLEEFGNLLSISQLTPGPVGINTATYVGFLQGGFFSSLAATIGLAFPTFILSSLAVIGIRKWKDTFIIRGIMRGTRLSSVALILYAVTIFLGMSVFTAPIPWEILRGAAYTGSFGVSISGLVIAVVSALAVWKKWCSTTVTIITGAAAGALLAFFGI